MDESPDTSHLAHGLNNRRLGGKDKGTLVIWGRVQPGRRDARTLSLQARFEKRIRQLGTIGP